MKIIRIVILLSLISTLSLITLKTYKKEEKEPPKVEMCTFTEEESSDYKIGVIVDGLDRPWGIGFLPTGEKIFTERVNKISLLTDCNPIELNAPEDTFVNGEGGMMAVTVDPKFEENSFVYFCFNSKKYGDDPNVLVSRFLLDTINYELTDRKDIIIDIPANPSGRHSGCQLEFGPDDYLWIGTGDTARQSEPQDPKTLGGKVLRVDRDGNPAEGNLEGDFDPRIFSYGHRNIQGLGFFNNDGYKDMIGVSIEHGPDRDDEVNLLLKGNFGWNPLPFYGEGTPMTNKEMYPDAIDALWESGYPTIAASGGTVINSEKWGKWQNSIAVAALKGSHILIISIDGDGSTTGEESILKKDYGRFRTIKEGLDGNLYLLTDNGQGDDKIIVLAPK